MWEFVLALQMLRPQRGDLLFSSWRRDARAAMTRAGLARVGQLLSLRAAQWVALSPNVEYFPDFLTPLEAAGDFGVGPEAIRITPKTRLDTDLRRVPDTRPLP